MIINEYNIRKTLSDNGFQYQIKSRSCIEFTHNDTYRIDFKNEQLIQIVKYNSTLAEGQEYHWQFKDMYNFIYWLIHTQKYY